MSAFRLSGLYAITPDGLETADLLNRVEAAIKGGVSVVQYRNKKASSEIRYSQAEALSDLTRRFDIPLIINDDPELAQAIDAAGAHIGGSDGDLRAYRQQYGASFMLGASCYNEIRRGVSAQAAGADYLAFGRFYPSHTKPGDIFADVSLLKEAKKNFHLPIVAIGGITVDNALPLIAAGADAIAVIANLFEATDIERQAAAFTQLFKVQ